MELYERRYVLRALGRIVLDTLLDRQAFQQLPRPTTFHPRTRALVKQANPKTHVNLHLLLLESASRPVLHDDIARVSAQLIIPTTDLANDPSVPLPLRLAGRDEVADNDPANFVPVRRRAYSEMRDDIHLRLGVQTRTMA